MPKAKPVPPEFRPLLDSGNLEALEDEWLSRLGQRRRTLAAEVEGFAAVAHHVAAGEEGDPDHARFLLEMLDEQLATQQMWRARLDLLRHAGGLLFDDAAEVHREIVATLEKLYGERSIWAGMAETVGLHRAAHDLGKTWDKVERLHGVMGYDVGTIVAMEGRGVGTIVDANFQLESFKVDFAHHAALNVGFRAAPKMLEPLPPEHILRRKVEDPESLAKLAADDPPQLLRVVLESRGRELTAGEVRKDLTGVVDDARWTSFWNAARKHPQVVVHGKGRQTYTWAASSDHAVEAVWSKFDAAPPRKQLELLRREGLRDAELLARMAASLDALGRRVAANDPGLAFEIWASLERAGAAPADGDDAPYSPASLLAGSASRAKALLAGVEDRSLREQAYREVHLDRDDWREIFHERLPREEDPRALDLMYDALRGDDETTLPKDLGSFLDGVLARPHRSPGAFVWLAERAASDLALILRNPQRLLQQIFAAMGRDEFKEHRPRLRALLEKGGTASKVFPELTEEQAPAAADAIHRAGYLEDYEREELQRALELSFPSLRGEAAKSDVLWATEASIQAKRAQLDDITRRELPANRKAIEEARAMGDLRENFEYKSARQRHQFLTALASKLQAELSRAKAIDFSRVEPTQVRLGTRCVLVDGAGARRTLAVLGPWESAPEAGVISYESELAQKLLGKTVGDAVEGSEGHSETVESIEVAAP